MVSDKTHTILKQYWGYDHFRPLQKEVIESVLTGHDTVVLFPTGGGKSLCFQVPAILMDGICIVITPLIALMKDQVDQLERRHIKAVAIHAGMGNNQIDYALDNCIYGNIKFLYVSPERLMTPLFLERVAKMNISLVAVDEAHCISQWGYDFRPAYLKISDFRQKIPGVPFIALTASATTAVKEDIIDKLSLQYPAVFSQSLARVNLSYSARCEENKERKLLHILQRVQGTAIVYAGTRRKVQELAFWLNKNNMSADFYHAGLDFRTRSRKQENWIQGKTRIMVATNAFGMGIDKPDVRMVVHFDMPDNLEAYYQEAGRAGRDEKKAYAVALFNAKDLDDLEEKIMIKYPDPAFLVHVYQCLANHHAVPVNEGTLESYDLDLPNFAVGFSLPVNETFHAIKLLEHEGFIQLNDDYNDASKLHIKVENQQLYDFQIRNPFLDKFIKLLLRLYGGELFNDFRNISERELARIYFVSEAEIIRYLTVLHENGIVDYEKRKEKPQLTYLTPRFAADKLPLNIQAIQHKKQFDLRKARAVAQYVSADEGCRTRILVEYFGEQKADPCKVCDLCMENRKHYQPEKEQEVAKKIMLILQDGKGILPRQLVEQLAVFEAEVVTSALQKLIVGEVVGYDSTGKINLL